MHRKPVNVNELMSLPVEMGLRSVSVIWLLVWGLLSAIHFIWRFYCVISAKVTLHAR